MNEEELMPLLKQLAEGVLKQKQIIEDLRARVARLEYVLTEQATAPVAQLVRATGS